MPTSTHAVAATYRRLRDLVLRAVGRILVGWPHLVRTRGPAQGQSGSSGLWATDPSLAAPTITSVVTTDNAVIVAWADTNPAPTGYLLFVSDRLPARGPGAGAVTEFFLPPDWRATWFVSLDQGLLRPGATLDLSLHAMGGRGLSPDTATATAVATLGAPTITIGDPASGAQWSPVAVRAVAPWDADGNGVVRDAAGSGGAFPLFPVGVPGQSQVSPGNRFDRVRGGPQANVVAGYFAQEGTTERFVAYHLHVDPVTNRPTPVSVLYGDTRPGVDGQLVWVSSGIAAHQLRVTDGDAALGTPNLVRGRVTAPTLAPDGSIRVVEFTFHAALLEQ